MTSFADHWRVLLVDLGSLRRNFFCSSFFIFTFLFLILLLSFVLLSSINFHILLVFIVRKCSHRLFTGASFSFYLSFIDMCLNIRFHYLILIFSSAYMERDRALYVRYLSKNHPVAIENWIISQYSWLFFFFRSDLLFFYKFCLHLYIMIIW